MKAGNQSMYQLSQWLPRHRTVYDFFGGVMKVSDETNYDWSGGKIRIVYDSTAAPPAAIPRHGFVNFQDPGIM